MSEELANQLHRLYRDYYARRLEFDDYRHRRALLLDSLDELFDDVAEPDLTTPRQRHASTEPEVRRQAAKQKALAGRSAFRWYYVLAACVVVIAAVVFAVTRQLEDSAPEPLASEPAEVIESPPLLPVQPEPEVVEVIQTPGVGQELVESFVARQDWRPMSLLEFQDSWTRLPEADRILAKGAVWFEPMSKSLAYEIDEVREFSADPENDEQLNRLYEFSLHLGLVELVPAGWMPDPEDINRGAESLAPAGQPGSLAAEKPAQVIDDEAAPAEAARENDRACTVAQLETRRRNCFDLLSDGASGPTMRVLPSGEFVLGGGADAAAGAARSVVLAEPFAMSLFEIKASEFRVYCRKTGSTCPAEPWSDDDMPVVDVSWHEAVSYAEWLSKETGFTYRLPTEEEWEYAMRAGTTTEYPFGDKLLPAQARYSSITNYDAPLPAGDRTTQRNEFGLWHVIGNVREWVDADWVDSDQDSGGATMKVVRGGSYASSEHDLRSSARQGKPANDKDSQTGFRLLREL